MSCAAPDGTSRATARLAVNGFAEASASGSNSWASASFAVFLRLAPKPGEPPPFDPDRLPITLTSFWSLDLSDRAGGSVRAWIVRQVGGQSQQVIAEPVNRARRSEPGVSLHLSPPPQASVFYGEPLGLYILAKRAECSVGSFVETGTCRAWVDPVFSFDQQEFDATWGAASFPLDDYYEIEMSENFLVPEAEGGCLALLALTALWWRARAGGRKVQRPVAG